MATTVLKSKVLFVVFLLVSSAFVVFEARPLSITAARNSAAEGAVDFFDWLSSLGAMKESGPSSGGKGHKFTNSETLGGIKDSGPSGGGIGHSVVTGTLH
ncbi:hypothetical protein L6164_027865 [Bauhinia variegata]|uniref:Uncharacterized protein n=1 Tax=Bauhinia variegata TaxID=167791 RepID=A0ACB9LUN4_BAUVA|nr:hypothetical protein L6164_027865 [Bauhinia variegata]